MAQSVIHLTQSHYYSTAFNAAVFDGPIRIYFAQHQENLALKVYFQLQQHLKDSYATLRKSFKDHGQTIFLMLYPTVEAFDEVFGAGRGNVRVERLGGDHVIGVRGPLEDDQCHEVFQKIETILQVLNLTPETELAPSPSL
jgi:hypothetical protein